MQLGELATRIGARLDGDASIDILRVADLASAQANELSFLSSSEYRPLLSATRAGAVIVREADRPSAPCAALVMSNPYLGYARAAQLLDTTPQMAPGVHPTAVVAADASLGTGVAIGPYAVIESGVHIGDHAAIGAHCVIGAGAVIGRATRLWPQVTVYHQSVIGERCLVHSGTVIGSDGFGFAPDAGTWVKIPQVGRVVIGDDVEIGANCAIDRGALSDTRIGNGVKLDNFIHVAHNVEIGDHAAMAAMTGIAGSSKIGKQVTLSGRVSVTGHLSICDNAHVTACTMVSRSITEPGAWSSGTTQQPNREWRKSAARFNQLDEMAKRLRRLERQLGVQEHGTSEE